MKCYHVNYFAIFIHIMPTHLLPLHQRLLPVFQLRKIREFSRIEKRTPAVRSRFPVSGTNTQSVFDVQPNHVCATRDPLNNLKTLLEAHFLAIRVAEARRDSGTGRTNGRKSLVDKDHCTRHVPGIGKNQGASAVMYFQKISCLFLLACSLGHSINLVFSQKPQNAIPVA